MELERSAFSCTIASSICSRSVSIFLISFALFVSVDFLHTNVYLLALDSIFVPSIYSTSSEMNPLSTSSIKEGEHLAYLVLHPFAEPVDGVEKGDKVLVSATEFGQLDDDLRLGQLNEPLPPTVKLPKVLPVAYADYLATGKYLPTLCMNQEKCATVLELAKTDCEVTDSSSRRHFHYGQLLSDNFCSEQRHAIRAATLGGNSGSPVFLVAGADLVFLFAKHLGSSTELTWCPFYGPTVMPRETLIQNMINQWEGEDAGLYQIDIMDLSVFEKLQRGESE